MTITLVTAQHQATTTRDATELQALSCIPDINVTLEIIENTATSPQTLEAILNSGHLDTLSSLEPMDATYDYQAMSIKALEALRGRGCKPAIWSVEALKGLEAVLTYHGIIDAIWEQIEAPGFDDAIEAFENLNGITLDVGCERYAFRQMS